MSQVANGTTAALEPQQAAAPAPRVTAAEQTPTSGASHNEVAPLNSYQATPSSTTNAPETETDPELLKQQLQLIQLCFAEHEFGIVVDEKAANGSSSSSSSSSYSSSTSSSRSSSEVSLTSPSGLRTGDKHSGVPAAAAAASSSRRGAHHGSRRHRHYSTYDPLTFVNGKVQHGVPLPVLSQDLHSYAQYLEDKIAACVNTDVHTAFVNVSGHLVGMRDELSYMERPLAVAMEKLSGAVAQLSTTSQGVKTKVEAACAAEMERNFDAVYLRGVVVYETIAYQLDDLAQLLHITVDASPSRASIGGATASTHAGGGGSASIGGAGHDAAGKSYSTSAHAHSGGNKRDAYSIAPGTRLTDASLDILEDVVLLFQELKEVSQRLVPMPSRQQEKADMAGYVAAAEQAVMGVLEVVLVHVSRLTSGLNAGGAAAAMGNNGSGATSAEEAAAAGENGAPSPAARQLLGRVIALYSQAGEREQFCAVFRNAVLRPPLEAVVSWKAATQARQSAEGTVALLEQMKAVLRTKYLPLLPLLRESYGAPLHPVATIVWPILSETLVKKLPSLFEVGIPNHFQVKYKAAYGVLALVEAACADLEELAALRQSPDVVLWNHKWNLDVYAALRVSEVDKALQSVSSPLDRLPPSSEGDYHLRVFYIVHQQLLHLFSPTVFLYLCTPRFLRQTVACCYRVLQRVQEAIARSPAHSPASNFGEDASAGAAGGNTVDGGAASAAAGGADPSANDLLLLAISDTHALRSFLTSQLLPLILDRLDTAADASGTAKDNNNNNDVPAVVAPVIPTAASERSTAALVTDVIEFASSTVCGQFVQQSRARLVQHVSDAAMGPLQNVKSVRSAYSHTRKTMPSAASWYVAPVLQPLQQFAAEAQRCGFAGAARDESVVEMLRAIVHQFVLLARETLITAKKTEESWEKLRRRKEGGGAAEASGEGAAGQQQQQQRVTMETATDRDKMTIQLWMDARALWEAVLQPPLSLPETAATDAFAPAFELLRRAEWIQGADIPEPPDVDA